MPRDLVVMQLQTKFGPLYCAATAQYAVAVDLAPRWPLEAFAAEAARRLGHAAAPAVDPAGHPVGRMLAAYLAGDGATLTLPPYLADQPPFRRAVLEAIRAIPPGQTWTYGRTAAELGKPKAARAVGQALHNNPVALFSPCHRIIGANGSLVGFGSGLAFKKALLEMEAGGPALA